MPALSQDGAVAAAGHGQAYGGASASSMPSNRRGQQQGASPASGSGPSAMQQHSALQECRFGQLRRKAPLTKRRTCFDSAEFFMAKEAGLAPPLYQPRTEPTCMLRKPSQPSRLSIGTD